MVRESLQNDRVVITGMGVITSTGSHRENAWQAICSGQSGARRMNGITGITDGMFLAAPVDLFGKYPGQLKNIPLCRQTAREALLDSGIEPQKMDRTRFGCSISGHMGDTDFVVERVGKNTLTPEGKQPWWNQWLPNTACSIVANDHDLCGPRLSNSTACASGTIAFLVAVRSILDGQCDVMLAGSSQAIHPLFAAGFHNMRVLANHEDPSQACRPFDSNRKGFVMGEGAAMLIVERLSHALDRGAQIYAEVLSGHIITDGQHVTSLDANSDALVHLITTTLRSANLAPHNIHHINAHGTGTIQNDAMEAQGIRRALGSAADSVCVTANKSMLGHLVNASGAVELAMTALSLRDGFAPPTVNLTDPDPTFDLDCVPLIGRQQTMDHALKLSIAFGGHMAAVALRRWSGTGERKSAIQRLLAA